MHLLVPLAGLLGIEIHAVTEQVKRTIATNVLMALLAVVGMVFLIVAGYLGLAERIGAVRAALWLGGIPLFFALLMFVSGRIGRARRKRISAEKRRSGEAGAFVTTAAMTALPALPALLKSPAARLIAVPAAAAAAYMLVRRSRRPD